MSCEHRRNSIHVQLLPFADSSSESCTFGLRLNWQTSLVGDICGGSQIFLLRKKTVRRNGQIRSVRLQFCENV